jgi:hypothetical protein
MRKTLVFHEENKTLVFLFKEYVKGDVGGHYLFKSMMPMDCPF